jgi:hypothetical protein
MPGGVRRVEAVDVGEEDEQVRFDERGHQRAEVVVVADLDFLDSDGVVLVDDRHHAEGEQGEQRVPRVQVPRAIADVLRRQENLAHGQAVSLERDLVLPHEHGLSDRGRRLFFRNRARALRQRETRHPGGDRAGGDERDVTVATHGRDVRGQLLDAIRIRTETGRGDEMTADLDDESPCLGKRTTCVRSGTRRRQLAARSHPVSSRRREIVRSRSGTPTPVAAEIA